AAARPGRHRHGSRRSRPAGAARKGWRLAAARAARRAPARVGSSELPAQIHPGVERGDLVGVAVEHQGLALAGEEAAFADPSLGGLGPARMRDFWIDVGIEAVL